MNIFGWRKKYEEVKQQTIDAPIVNSAKLPDYYFTVEAKEYREEIEELKRQLRLAKEARLMAEEHAALNRNLSNSAGMVEMVKNALKTLLQMLES